MSLVPDIDWSHEGDKLAWDDPVEVPVLDLLIVLVLLNIKSFEAIPAMAQGLLQSLQTVQNGQLVVALALAGVSVVKQLALVGSEKVERVLSLKLEDYDHESAHQEASIRHLLWACAASVVVDLGLARELITVQQLCQLTAVAVDH